MKIFSLRFLFCSAAVLASWAVLPAAEKTEPVPVHKANYQLAMRWTPPQLAKLVFDTSVTPQWLQDGHRFWYSYETPKGRHFYLVDPVKKTKTPVFDNARMAEMLTEITRNPYDAAHPHHQIHPQRHGGRVRGSRRSGRRYQRQADGDRRKSADRTNLQRPGRSAAEKSRRGLGRRAPADADALLRVRSGLHEAHPAGAVHAGAG